VFITDFCNTGTLYRFASTGGTTSMAEASSSNGLDLGLATSGGGYFGAVDHNNGPLTAGLFRFDPNTLAVGAQIFNDGNGVRDIAVDPITGDLYFSVIGVGIYHMAAPNSATPASVEFASGDFDGLAFTSDGSTLYAANFGNKHFNAFNRAGTLTLDVDPGHPVDGMTIDRNGNVYANANDGTVVQLNPTTKATSVVASGGNRGDLARVGPDGCMYATQTDRVSQLQPCFFNPSPTPTPSPSPTAATAATSVPNTGAAPGGGSGLGLILLATGALVSGVATFGRRHSRRGPGGSITRGP
jgi:hypothetical protein